MSDDGDSDLGEHGEERTFAASSLSRETPRSARRAASLLTEPSPVDARRQPDAIRRFRVKVIEGPGSGLVRESTADSCSIGSHPLNDLVIEDGTVSRFHCEIRVQQQGAAVVDLRSRNGTIVDGVHVKEAFLRGGSILRLGRAVVRFDFGAQNNRLPVSERESFGALVGSSLPMRTTFALLERTAASEVTVLLEGETGTGKGKAAEGIHRQGARKTSPFMVVDCSAMSGSLLESELFGHEKGAFTSADARRIGAFEEANGGTVFLDEIGELPADLQPKLLRVLENREFRRLGSNRFMPANVRVVAATNRDLRAEVNAGRFRSDLYYRLAVVKIRMPPLRQRPEDIPSLVQDMLASMNIDDEARQRLLSPAFLQDLQRGVWSGNVRELRNHIERCVVIRDTPSVHSNDSIAPPPPRSAALPSAPMELVPFAKARRQNQAAFEKQYLQLLLQRCGGNIHEAAALAGIDRVYVYRLLKRNGMKPG